MPSPILQAKGGNGGGGGKPGSGVQMNLVVGGGASGGSSLTGQFDPAAANDTYFDGSGSGTVSIKELRVGSWGTCTDGAAAILQALQSGGRIFTASP